MTFQHILSTQQFLDNDLIQKIFLKASELEAADKIRAIPPILHNRIMACVFYEPSTRTRFSFTSAMLKLGGQVIATENAAQFSSAIKGETIEDSTRIISAYADVIVMRHTEAGAAERAAKVALVPVVNAGDGVGEHPTQALLDLYTIKKEIGRTDNLKIAMVGDLLNGRTIHSIIYLLSLSKNIELFLVSPDELKVPESYKQFMTKHQIKFTELNELVSVLPQIDVLYMTRVQKERFATKESYERVKNVFILEPSILTKLKPKSIIMHPLPRVNELSAEIDSDPRAAYFREARNGLYVRMALLSMLIG